MEFEKVKKEYDSNGKRLLVPTGEAPVIIPCDDVLCAIGQENSFPWVERDLGIEFDQWEVPILNKSTFQSTHDKVFFGGDAALGGPRNGRERRQAAGVGRHGVDAQSRPARRATAGRVGGRRRQDVGHRRHMTMTLVMMFVTQCPMQTKKKL